MIKSSDILVIIVIAVVLSAPIIVITCFRLIRHFRSSKQTRRRLANSYLQGPADTRPFVTECSNDVGLSFYDPPPPYSCLPFQPPYHSETLLPNYEDIIFKPPEDTPQ